MGRRKISIAPIADDRNRQVTFLKRKNGLFKKAYELGVLCSADVAVVVFNANGKLFEFHSGDMDSILLRYSHYAGPPHEKRGPEDYMNKDLAAATKKGMGGKMTTLSDEDDEDDEDEPKPATGSSGVKVIPASKGKQAIRAAQERKAKEASLSRAGSEDVQQGAGSSSRSNSQSGPHPFFGQPPVNGFPQPFPPGSQPYPGMQVPAGSPLPPQQPQAFGLPPFGTPNPQHPGLPSLPTGLTGLPAPPNFPLSFPGVPPYFPFPNQQQHPQASTASGAPGGVPAWFAAPNPQAAAAAAGAMGGLPSHAQLLQQLQSGPGGFPWPDPNAMLAYPAQQPPPAPLHPQPAQPALGFGMPPPFSQPTPQPHHSSPAVVAPMYGSPAAMSYASGASPEDHSSVAASTPGPSQPLASSHGSSSSHHTHPSAPPNRQDSLSNKPRLSVAIPAGGSGDDGKKPGLVTAGGASILGAGIGQPEGGPFVQEPEVMEDENGPATAVPRSAFAADLLASPFFPSASTSTSYPFASSSAFVWPTAPGPAPMLDEDEAPDLIRREPVGGPQDGTLNRLKRGSVDLEEGIESMGVESASEAGVGAGDGDASEVSDGNGGRVRKRRA
ncbi:hypothetical protein JCM10213_007943 [Rhodosporidiobolus nylandii]